MNLKRNSSPKNNSTRRRWLPAFAILLLLLFTECIITVNANDKSTTNGRNDTGKSTKTHTVNAADCDFSMHVLDVGQGLSVLFESEGHYLLYDGGDRDYSSAVVSYLKKQKIQTIDYMIASHYDSDHISGLVGALNVFDVDTVIAPDYSTDTKIYNSFQNAVKQENLTITAPVPETEYTLGDCDFTILSPLDDEYSNENNYSIAIRIACGDTSVIVTGDATVSSEEEMIDSNEELDSDILIVGHHGSAGSTSQDFLDQVTPDAAIISCEENGQYQHPSQEVMERLQDDHISVFRTDKQGTIDISSNGEEFTYTDDPCNDYSYGEEESTTAHSNGSGSAASSAYDTYDSLEQQQTEDTYVLNYSSMKFHYPSCKYVRKIAPKNYGTSSNSREKLLEEGFSPCGICKP